MRVSLKRIREHIETISNMTSTPGAGATRLSFSPEYREACDYVADRARALGLSARYDAIGNLRLRLEGTNPGLAPVVIASHLDTVRNGGNFDGVLGVVCGLDVAETLKREGIRIGRSLEIISFVEEEGASFGCPLAGSKALTGFMDAESIRALKDVGGRTFSDTARRFGIETADVSDERLRPGDVHAMLEIHIEQGRVLESEGISAGIVDRIAGSENYRLALTGMANHAGATPMHLRQDALAGAAEIVLAVERIAGEPDRHDTVATVGHIACVPDTSNVIPGKAEISLDIRAVDTAAIEACSEAIRGVAEDVAKRRGLHLSLDLTGKSDPCELSPKLRSLLETVARNAGIPARRMHSGALHDTAMMSHVTDAGLIFVPSRDGRSHCPDEWTDYEDLVQGADLLLHASTALCME